MNQCLLVQQETQLGQVICQNGHAYKYGAVDRYVCAPCVVTSFLLCEPCVVPHIYVHMYVQWVWMVGADMVKIRLYNPLFALKALAVLGGGPYPTSNLGLFLPATVLF